MSTQEIPPWLREQLARFEQVQQSLQSILVQKQQTEMEIGEVDGASAQLSKTEDDVVLYKSAGTIMVRAKKADMVKELEERKDLANTRKTVLGKQEARLRESAKELQAKINEAVKGRTQSSGS